MFPWGLTLTCSSATVYYLLGWKVEHAFASKILSRYSSLSYQTVTFSPEELFSYVIIILPSQTFGQASFQQQYSHLFLFLFLHQLFSNSKKVLSCKWILDPPCDCIFVLSQFTNFALVRLQCYPTNFYNCTETHAIQYVPQMKQSSIHCYLAKVGS